MLEWFLIIDTPAMKRRERTLAIHLGRKSGRLLVAFVNTRPDAKSLDQFEGRWGRWTGGQQGFLWSQSIVRAIWEGKKKGIEGLQIANSIGLFPERDEDPIKPPIAVDWNAGCLTLAPRNLEDVVWLALLQHSQQLAVCANHKNECPSPYFLRWRPNHRFCSAECAQSAQQEYKRKWWKDHGPEWRKARRNEVKEKAGKRR